MKQCGAFVGSTLKLANTFGTGFSYQFQCCCDRPLGHCSINTNLCGFYLASFGCYTNVDALAGLLPRSLTIGMASCATQSIVYLSTYRTRTSIVRSSAYVRTVGRAVSSHHIGSTPVGTSTPPKLCSQGGIDQHSTQDVWAFVFPSRLELWRKLATNQATKWSLVSPLAFVSGSFRA